MYTETHVCMQDRHTHRTRCEHLRVHTDSHTYHVDATGSFKLRYVKNHVYTHSRVPLTHSHIQHTPTHRDVWANTCMLDDRTHTDTRIIPIYAMCVLIHIGAHTRTEHTQTHTHGAGAMNTAWRWRPAQLALI